MIFRLSKKDEAINLSSLEKKNELLRWDLNPRHTACQVDAQPLSYQGNSVGRVESRQYKGLYRKPES